MTGMTNVLPYDLPNGVNARIALFAIRRMGAHGLADARAAHALFTAFGEMFRRPLVLLRTLMADLASTATGSIAIAPCCCARMTHAEAALVDVLARGTDDPARARLLLADLTGVRHVDGLLATVAVLASAFADAGRPITA
jgi:hypothetical protein